MQISKIEQRAEDIIEESGFTELPIKVEKIAEKLSIRIKKSPSDEFSGLLIFRDSGKSALIALNSEEPETRQRFTVAHEIGHFLLHKSHEAFVDFLPSHRRNKTSIHGSEELSKEEIQYLQSPKEKEANAFAAALLMPRNTLIKDLKKYKSTVLTEVDILTLASKYNVSEDAMRFRIMNLSKRSLV